METRLGVWAEEEPWEVGVPSHPIGCLTPTDLLLKGKEISAE